MPPSAEQMRAGPELLRGTGCHRLDRRLRCLPTPPPLSAVDLRSFYGGLIIECDDRARELGAAIGSGGPFVVLGFGESDRVGREEIAGRWTGGGACGSPTCDAAKRPRLCGTDGIWKAGKQEKAVT